METTTSIPLTPEADAEHFRRLLETQPAVLMRVALTGAILAANDAALGLLGAGDRDHLADLELPACIAPGHAGRWEDFTAAIREGASKSFECDFTTLVGTTRQVVFHGVPLLDHADGTPSVILSGHDVTTVRRVESAIERRAPAEPESQEPQTPAAEPERLRQLERLLKEGRAHLLELRAQVDQARADARAEHARLTELLDLRDRHVQAAAERQQFIEEELRGALAERERLEALLNERHVVDDSLAQARLELELVNAATSDLLPLVSTGRLAMEISQELNRIVSAIDAQAASLLAGTAPESPAHEEIRRLRADALTASLLSREILFSCDRSSGSVVLQKTTDDANTPSVEA